MPQMMPINWIMFYLLTIIIYMIFTSMKYYIFQKNTTNKVNKMKLIKNISWK